MVTDVIPKSTRSLNTDKINFLNFPEDIIGEDICMVNHGFDIRTNKNVIPVNFSGISAGWEPAHGTCCAEIVAALARAKVHAFISHVEDAVDYCIDKGIKIISHSLSDGTNDEILKKAEDHDITFVTSCGNTNGKGLSNPAWRPYPISVAGYNVTRGLILSDSAKGPQLDISAPSNWLILLYNGKVYDYFGGSSGAAPVIASALSLYQRLFPKAKHADRKEFLFKNVIDYGVKGPDEVSGHGIFTWPEDLKAPIDRLMDTAPFIKDSRTFVPVRFLAEAFGDTVDWDNETQRITVTRGREVVTMWIGRQEYKKEFIG